MSEYNGHSKISSILVATDGSAHGESAVEYGAWLAARARADLTVIYVIDARQVVGHFINHYQEVIGNDNSRGILKSIREYYKTRGRQILERAALICEHYDVGCRRKLKSGNVLNILAEEAAEADLLVMGQHGADEAGGLIFPESVTEKIVRKSKYPVLVTQPPFREFHQVLLAFDGSGAARRVMHTLAQLSTALDIEIDAVQLVEANEPTTALIEVPRFFKEVPVRVNAHYLVSDRISAILDHAADEKCDLLAMGAYADMTAEKLGLGSTTEYLMSNSTVPVLVHH